jgi:hypothetical protein
VIGDTPDKSPLKSGPPPLPSARLVEVPEDALQALLQGSGQTVEEFLRANRARIQTGREFQKRANAAKWSRLWLAASTLFCLVSLVTGRDIEDLISLVLLGSMTCVEFKVRNWFLNGDPRGAIYGYWNQTLFAALFLIYGAYHFVTASTPRSATEMLDASYAPLVLQLSRIFYAVVGLVGAAGQYALALYYKRSLRQN